MQHNIKMSKMQTNNSIGPNKIKHSRLSSYRLQNQMKQQHMNFIHIQTHFTSFHIGQNTREVYTSIHRKQ